MKHGKLLAAGAVCAAGLLVVGLMTGAKPQEDEIIVVDSRIVVETTSPQIGDIIVTGEYVGTVEPNQKVTVYPKVTAEVLAVNYKVGDTVQAGDVLFELDSTALRNNIAQTQANISSSQAKAQLSLEIAQQNLSDYQTGVADGYNSNIMQAEAAVESAEVALQQANASLRSARDAYRDYRDEYGDYDDDYTIDSQFTQLRNARVQAEIQVEAAQLKLGQTEASLEAVKKQVAEGSASVENSVKSAELATDFSSNYISLGQLQNDLKYYTVTSTISGIIEQRNVDPHDLVSSQSPTFVISNKDAMIVSFQVSETTWKNTQPGDLVVIDKDGATWPGTVTEISTMAGAGSGLYTIKASVENAPFDLPTGSVVKVRAETQSSRTTLTIPMDTIYYDGSTPYILVYENGLSKKTVLETGISDGTDIEVLSGLWVGELIITTWNSAMSDGTKVVLLEDYQASLQAAEEPAAEIDADSVQENSDADSEAEVPADDGEPDVSLIDEEAPTADSEE